MSLQNEMPSTLALIRKLPESISRSASVHMNVNTICEVVCLWECKALAEESRRQKVPNWKKIVLVCHRVRSYYSTDFSQSSRATDGHPTDDAYFRILAVSMAFLATNLSSYVRSAIKKTLRIKDSEFC